MVLVVIIKRELMSDYTAWARDKNEASSDPEDHEFYEGLHPSVKNERKSI